ncbi:DUF222 domain-containing protein [Leucobacter tenebrionis]|uniref:DUF222 domain-containing protein n=1 Tax=Leucobacter tenebrionis TaxID=2873270 RepID=UPI001CA664CE|nr:DUF222 domain-containing protein [Leucobacter tenebrionis]QZY52054.1 DUF222 domain-containing protein [Leucobacter tenebrionis]
MSPIPFSPGGASHAKLLRLASDLEEVERGLRGLDARKTELLAEVARLTEEERDQLSADSRSAEMAHRAAAAEVAFVLGIADRSAEHLMERAYRLHEQYPRVHASLAAGRIALAHAVGVVDAGVVIDAGGNCGAGGDSDAGEAGDAGEASDAGGDSGPGESRRAGGDAELDETRAAYEIEALTVAEAETPNRVRRLAKVIAEKHAARTLEQRFERAHSERRVWVTELGDGMAELHAVADAVSVYAVHDRLSRQAHEVRRSEVRVQRAATEAEELGAPRPRSLDQIRADLAVDLLLNGAPSNSSGVVGLERLDARVQVTVPASVLLASDYREGTGRGAGAAVLAGFGPIDAATARRVAAVAAGWDRSLFDPGTGELLKVDRYRPSAEIVRFLEARDQYCRFPGCTVPPFRADRDHTLDAALGGDTSTGNLALLCRRHHTMKHHAGVKVQQLRGGDLLWRSPSGRARRDRPPSRVMFRAVKGEGDRGGPGERCGPGDRGVPGDRGASGDRGEWGDRGLAGDHGRAGASVAGAGPG